MEDKYLRSSGSHSIEENMRETIIADNILPPPQRKEFMKLFGKFLESRSRPPMDWKQVRGQSGPFSIHPPTHSPTHFLLPLRSSPWTPAS